MINQSTHPTDIDRMKLWLTLSLYGLTFTWAISYTMIGPLIPVYIRQYGISLGEGGLLSASVGLGGTLAVIAGIFIADKLEKSIIIRYAWIAFSLTLLLLSLVNSYALIIALFFIIGSSTKMLDAIINANVADIHEIRRGFFVNFLHVSFGLGALTGPFFSTLFIRLDIPINLLFVALGLICLLAFLPYLHIFRMLPHHARLDTKTEDIHFLEFAKSRNVLLLCLAVFLYVGFSTAISTWMPTYLLTVLKTSVVVSGLPGSAFWLGVIFGRILFSVLQERIDTRKLVITGNLLGGLVFITMAIQSDPKRLLGATVLLGFVSGVIVPMSVALACTLYPKNKGTVSSLIFLFTALGQMLIPWILVYVAVRNFQLSIGLIGALAIVTATILVFVRTQRNPSHQP